MCFDGHGAHRALHGVGRRRRQVCVGDGLGAWRTIKRRGVRVKPIEVDMYPLRVTQQHETWEEQLQRRRHWAGLREARQLLYDPYLADLAMMLRDAK